MSFLSSPSRFAVLLASLCFLVGWATLSAQYAPPVTYYFAAEGLTGNALRAELNARIKNHAVQSYANVATAIPLLDEDPAQPGNIILIYSGYSIPVSGSWNREHMWPQSFGADRGPANSDFHHLFPANPSTNSSRSNYAFDWVPTGSPSANAPESKVSSSLQRYEPRDGDKGRVARAMFYMDVRYEDDPVNGDFRLGDIPSSTQKTMGILNTLLVWNRMYPPDTREQRRNHLIYEGFRLGNTVMIQGNRNPFIDYPEMVDAVYTATLYQTWGSYRWQHFTRAELADAAVSGPLADPDGDGLPNIFELTQNTDPRAATAFQPTVSRNSTGRLTTFTYRRLKQADNAGVQYTIEYSETPTTADSWTVFPTNLQSVTVTDDGLAQIAAVRDLNLPPIVRPRHFRLRVRHNYPVGQEIELVFDPVGHAATSDSVFRYFPLAGDGTRATDWFGVIDDRQWPVVTQPTLGEVYLVAQDEESVWIYDYTAGWQFSGRTTYPHLYDAVTGSWLKVVSQSPAGERWVYDYALAAFRPF
jgi:endonuclease I